MISQDISAYWTFSQPVLSVIEPCLHEVTFKDICAICGTDLSMYIPLLLTGPALIISIERTIQETSPLNPTFP